jgi:predicted alpha-1,2-mannosidase
MTGMRVLPVLFVVACTGPEVTPPEPITPYDPLEFVDPFIATGGIGAGVSSVGPHAARPFGMVRVGPDTRDSGSGAPGFYHCGGYYHPDDRIDGFSHTHAHGMGVTDYGGIHVMSRSGWDDSYTGESARSAPFDHAEEWAEPGWYSVVLQDTGTTVEIAASERGAVHTYTFVDTSAPTLLFDLGHTLGSDEVGASNITVDGTQVTGFQLLRGGYSERFGGLQTHFAAEVDPAPIAVGTWADDAPQPDTTTASGLDTGAWLTFPAGTETVTLRLAISYVDPEGARANLDAEGATSTVQELRGDATAAWRDELSGVRVRGGTERQRRIFHTAMYHAYMWPSLFQDTDGRYRGIDGEVHSADFTYYSDFSLWDTFRTLHPWLIMARPERQADMSRSLVRMYTDGGSLPRWPLGHGYTGGMVGSPATQVLAESWLKGLTDFDVEAGFEAAWRHSQGPMPDAGRGGIEAYLDKGYVTTDAAGGSASLTLEYAWNDHALSLWADALGKTSEAETLRQQASGWRGLWNPENEFLVGRAEDGTFDPFDVPVDGEQWWDDSYVEGGAWQYVWGVPQDVDGMVQLQHGGDYQAWFARMGGFWEESYIEEDDAIFDSFYWHGNEPDLHYAFLPSLAGELDRTVWPARFVLDKKYDDTPDGLDGNDDGGTLSAWYLWASIGLYPIAGTADYALGSPLFDRVEIDHADGTLVIDAPGSGVAWWPQRATLGDTEVAWPVVTHDELVTGENLTLHMGLIPGGWTRARSLSQLETN